MKTNHEHFINKPARARERGNALIYVLIAVALFAALSMTLGRQTDTNEAGGLSDQKADLYATQLIGYAAQAKSAIDQMGFTGTDVDEFDFMLPTDANFETGSPINKVYHPAGGGLNPGRIPVEATTQISASPIAGWYMGRFNNVEWTETTNMDVILVAYQIKKEVCEKINEKITGSTAIPQFTGSMLFALVDDSLYVGTNNDLTEAYCPGCNKAFTLCVSNGVPNAWSFYSILADQ